jgi:hypothetical protein
MKKYLTLLITLVSLNSFGSQFQAYLDEGCDQVMETLAKDYLSKDKSVYDQKLSQKYNNHLTVDAASATFCGVKDLGQGSYDVTRFVKICVDVLDFKKNAKAAVIYLRTQGDLFCDNESVLSLEDIWLD